MYKIKAHCTTAPCGVVSTVRELFRSLFLTKRREEDGCSWLREVPLYQSGQFFNLLFIRLGIVTLLQLQLL